MNRAERARRAGRTGNDRADRADRADQGRRGTGADDVPGGGRRRVAVVSSAAGAVLVVAGVATALGVAGADGSAGQVVHLKAEPTAAVRAAGSATAKAGTAQVDTVVTMTTPAVAAHGKTLAQPRRTVTMHGTGLFDFAKELGRVDVSTAEGGLQEVLTPATLYVRNASMSADGSLSGQGWQRFDIGRLGDGNLVSGGSTDPAMAVALLGGATPDVRYVGPDTVRGAAVAHYEGTLDLVDAASAAAAPAGDADAAAAKKALVKAAHAFTTTRIPFDAYLDAQGRLRRFVARFQFAMPNAGDAVAQVTSATELYGFGVHVAESVPVAPSAPTPAPHVTTGAATPATRRTSVTTVSSSPTRAHK